MLNSVFFYLCFLFSAVIFCESARILAVFPTPSISHQVVFRPLVQELVKRGHEVVVLTTDPVFEIGKAPKNLTEIDVHDMSYKYWREAFFKYATGKSEDLSTQVRVLYNVIGKLFDMQLKTSEMKKLIDEKQHFDLLILEAWVKPTLVLSHIFKAPIIQMSSFGRLWYDYENFGAPVHQFLYPLCIHQRIYNLTLWEKFNELYVEYHYKNMMSELDVQNNAWIKKNFGSDVPSLSELNSKVDLLFLNTHPIWEGNNPIPPAVIHTWGLHHKPEQALPKDLKQYMDESKHGVIYMSFGTNTDPALLPPEKIQMFINVFAKLPYNILWKWNRDVLPGQTDNIKISKWFPQSDLLRHPKLKLFITQGGLQSTDEAIVAGVPLIGIPMLGDQWYNTEKYLHHGIGLKLNIETVTEEELMTAIKEVIGNERYRKNIKNLGNLMRDEPQPALERAVWWVDYVLRHGGAKHLRAPAANISWWQYLELDLVITLLIGFLISLLLLLVLLYYLYTFVGNILLTNEKLKSS